MIDTGLSNQTDISFCNFLYDQKINQKKDAKCKFLFEYFIYSNYENASEVMNALDDTLKIRDNFKTIAVSPVVHHRLKSFTDAGFRNINTALMFLIALYDVLPQKIIQDMFQ